jgi:hypothetical protein
MGQIMLMHHGSTYRYLQREFFPKMRNATDITVLYREYRRADAAPSLPSL